ncbi:Uncharacterised protein [Mycobacteroides abscessus subsp. abscessus]|nr:Uncharacterised protein [Mycobacteroides abscessus subsp. abscessus]
MVANVGLEPRDLWRARPRLPDLVDIGVCSTFERLGDGVRRRAHLP